MSRLRTLAAAALPLALVACAGGPVAPAWQQEAQGALARYQAAALAGEGRAAQAEFRRAREALAATGDARAVARAELLRCAVQVAALDFSACEGFERLRADSGEAERAYADYLAGRPLTPAARGLLPADQQRALPVGDAQSSAASNAASTAAPHAATTSMSVSTPAPADLAPALRAIEDPVARLVAAGVALRRGDASPQLLQLAADTASAQGWRQPLLAWLGAQALRADQAGDAAGAQQLRRRMDLVSGKR